MVEIQVEWLKQLWQEAERNGRLAQMKGGGESVFAPRRTDPYRPDFDEPNWAHPWVRSVLRKMPIFRPVYIIRLCTRKCV